MAAVKRQAYLDVEEKARSYALVVQRGEEEGPCMHPGRATCSEYKSKTNQARGYCRFCWQVKLQKLVAPGRFRNKDQAGRLQKRSDFEREVLIAMRKEGEFNASNG